MRQAGSAAQRMLQGAEACLQGTQAASRNFKGDGPGAQECDRDEYDILLNPPHDFEPSNLPFALSIMTIHRTVNHARESGISLGMTTLLMSSDTTQVRRIAQSPLRTWCWPHHAISGRKRFG